MMTVVVYPRLAELLEERHITVEDLKRWITDQFGLAVDATTLLRLTEPTPVRQADMELAGAAAAVLGVGLDDLFTVATLPEKDEAVLDAPDSKRLETLLSGQDALSEEERAELQQLLAQYGRLLHVRRMREVSV